MRTFKDKNLIKLQFSSAAQSCPTLCDRMNKYNVRRATKGLAGYLNENPENAKRGVVIGYDSRNYSAEFAKDTALTLCAEGVPAFLFDALRPVPLLSYAVRHLNAAAGIVITASHNPPQYNGYKVYGEDGAQVGPETAEGPACECSQHEGAVFPCIIRKKTPGSKYSSTSGLSPRGHLERQAEFHASTQDEA